MALAVLVGTLPLLVSCGAERSHSESSPIGTTISPTSDAQVRRSSDWQVLDGPFTFEDGARAICFRYEGTIECARVSSRATTVDPLSVFDLECGAAHQSACTFVVHTGT